MKEPVRRAKRPWLVGLCVAAIAALYFLLLAGNRYPEPRASVVYDVEALAQVDAVETRFEETGRIEPRIEGAQAIAVGPGKIYVAGKGTVVVLGEDGAELARFPVNGTPSTMAPARDGTLFLGMRDHVVVIDSRGAVQATWGGLGPRAYITSIALAGEDVYVADAGNRVVMRYDRAGVLQGRIAEADPHRDVPGLVVPSPYLDIALDEGGALWVVNPGRLGLESYRSNGDLITSWYRPSMKLDGFAGCCNPSHIAFLSDGRLVTGEKGLARVKIYDVTSGEFQELVAGSAVFPRAQTLTDLAVDANDRILVLDPRQKAIRIFEIKGEEHG